VNGGIAEEGAKHVDETGPLKSGGLGEGGGERYVLWCLTERERVRRHERERVVRTGNMGNTRKGSVRAYMQNAVDGPVPRGDN
jgi:hypothetical protein